MGCAAEGNDDKEDFIIQPCELIVVIHAEYGVHLTQPRKSKDFKTGRAEPPRDIAVSIANPI